MPAKKKAKAAKSRKARRRSGARTGPALEFNHAMIYVREVPRALDFYAGKLGFRVIEQFGAGYARLRSPAGNTTIALHQLGEDVHSADAPGIRLYFEAKNLDAFCRRLATAGVHIKKMPQQMPWGWRHAYLDDPDGHEISLYWAGTKRLRTSRM
jgi:catechol 2,3-dioxygenase-like lactoylglutathione lyase family enzyme